MNARTFSNSQETLQFLQKKYGTANYSEWQSYRRLWWSYVNYPAAGATEFAFFGDVPGTTGISRQDTDMPKAGSFGQEHFLLKQIRLDIRVPNPSINATLADDLDTLYSDIVAGLTQGGVFELDISGRIYCQIPRPFLYAPPAAGRPDYRAAGLQGLTLGEGTPNTFTSLITAPPFASLKHGRDCGYIMDPNLLIEAEQSFQATLRYGTAVPVISTDVFNAETNQYQVGVIFDGIGFRPVT